MPRGLLLPPTLESSGTMSVELHWRLIDRLGNSQTSLLFALLLDRPRGNFLTTGLLRLHLPTNDLGIL